MTRNRLWVGMGVAAALVALAGVAGLYWVLGPTEAASGRLTAVPLDLATQRPAAGTAVSSLAAATDSAGAPVSAEATTVAAATTVGKGLTVLQIDPAQSEVRFILTEELRGQLTTVVGTTDQVAGEIAVDPADLSTAQVGIIQVNARTLATDQLRRNQAIRNRILLTDQYELITFAPTGITGLSGSGNPGDTFTFQIAGDLTIRDVTQPVVFEVTATARAGDELVGTATTTVRRADYGLAIPSVPFVANVSDEVRLEFDFVAAGG